MSTRSRKLDLETPVNPFVPPIPDRSSSRMQPSFQAYRRAETPLVRPSPLAAFLPPTPSQSMYLGKSLRPVSSHSSMENQKFTTPPGTPAPNASVPVAVESITPTQMLSRVLNTSWTPPSVTLPVTPPRTPQPVEPTPPPLPPSDSKPPTPQATKPRIFHPVVNTPLDPKSPTKRFWDSVNRIIDRKRANMFGFQEIDEKAKKRDMPWKSIVHKFTPRKGPKEAEQVTISRGNMKVKLETIGSDKYGTFPRQMKHKSSTSTGF